MKPPLRAARLAGLCALLAAVAACNGTDTKDYYDVGTTFNRLHRDPDQACTYVAAHANTFGDRFGRCAVQHLNSIQAEITRLQKYCGDIFLDPEDALLCEQDKGVPDLQRRLLYLSGVVEITTRSSGCALFGCSCTSFANFFQPRVDLFNTVKPLGKTWEETMDDNLVQMQTDYAC